MGWKADCFLSHLVVEFCTNHSFLSFTNLLTKKCLLKKKVRLSQKFWYKYMRFAFTWNFLERLVRTIVLSKMSKMHFHKKWVQNASNQLFLRLTFSFTSLLSNFFSTQVFSLLCIESLVMHRSSFYSWLGFCCFATRNNSILFACLPWVLSAVLWGINLGDTFWYNNLWAT